MPSLITCVVPFSSSFFRSFFPFFFCLFPLIDSSTALRYLMIDSLSPCFPPSPEDRGQFIARPICHLSFRWSKKSKVHISTCDNFAGLTWIYPFIYIGYIAMGSDSATSIFYHLHAPTYIPRQPTEATYQVKYLGM
ncbi:hypothetical protein F4809DRAFT_614111 [Biscogniauxia mediterranea]|nr:hypothetical protein F4809DRAFT_614111 [Biscogniauxia mediterranea]